MTNLATLEVDVRSNAERAKKDLDAVQKTLVIANKAADQATKGTASLSRGQADLARTTANLRREQEQVRASVTSLGQGMRELTTGMLGSNVAAVTLGVTIGALLTQAVMRAAQAVLQSVDAFAKLRNELIETREIGLNAGAAFEAIQQAAVGSQKSLPELTASYKALAGQISLTEIGIDKFNEVFVNYQRALGALQAPTFGSEFSRLFDKLASTFNDPAAIKNITDRLAAERTLFDTEEKRFVLKHRLNELGKQSLFDGSQEVRLRRELARLSHAE